MSAEQPQPSSPPSAIRIPAAYVQCGMFIVELDRAWLSVLSGSHGFLISSDIEAYTLQRYCRYVHVDIARSTPEAGRIIQHLQEIKEAASPSPKHVAPTLRDRSFPLRVDIYPNLQARTLFQNFVHKHRIAKPAPTTKTSQWIRLLQRVFSVSRWGNPLVKQAATNSVPIRNTAADRAAQKAVIGAIDMAQRFLDEAIRSGCRKELFSRANSILQQLAPERHGSRLLWFARRQEEAGQPCPASIRRTIYASLFASTFADPKDRIAFQLAALLLDIGKINLAEALTQRPGTLLLRERAFVKHYVERGLDMLVKSGGFSTATLQAVAQHQECLDGSGYPMGLRGQAIHRWGIMLNILNRFTAITSQRPYANPRAPQEALTYLYRCSPFKIDRTLLEEFALSIGIFPVGSLVELSTGQVAAVRAHNTVHRLAPQVLLLSDTNKHPLEVPVDLDCHTAGHSIVRGLPNEAHGLKLPCL